MYILSRHKVRVELVTYCHYPAPWIARGGRGHGRHARKNGSADRSAASTGRRCGGNGGPKPDQQGSERPPAPKRADFPLRRPARGRARQVAHKGAVCAPRTPRTPCTVAARSSLLTAHCPLLAAIASLLRRRLYFVHRTLIQPASSPTHARCTQVEERMQANVASVKSELEAQMSDRFEMLEAKVERCESLLKQDTKLRKEDKEIMVSTCCLPSAGC